MSTLDKTVVKSSIWSIVTKGLSPTTEEQPINNMSVTNEDLMREMRDSFRILNHKQDALEQQVRQLKAVVQEKDEQIETLTSRIDELEQYTRRENIVISGLTCTPEKLEDDTVHFLQSKQIPISKSDISDIHYLGKPTANKSPPIVIRFVSRKARLDVLKNRKNLTKTKVFINEQLTSKNNELSFKAREMVRRKEILSTFTRNGQVYIKFGSLDNPKFKAIKCEKDFDIFSRN